jgi:cytochrome c2
MKLILSFAVITAILTMMSCGGSETQENVDKGVGPISTVFIGNLDAGLANQGSKIFAAKCTACHKIEAKYIGPALKGVTARRSPEWIMNMIINPDKMIKENEAAKQLFAQYMTPMANQNIKQDEARAILEYLRSVNP